MQSEVTVVQFEEMCKDSENCYPKILFKGTKLWNGKTKYLKAHFHFIQHQKNANSCKN
jgi:hypothetical protein